MRSDIIDALSKIGKAEIATINSIADSPFEVLSISILPQNRGANACPKAVIPESIQTLLREKLVWKRQFLTNNEKALVSASGSKTSLQPALVPKIAGAIFILAYEVPVGNILDAIHADTIDTKIAHP